MIANDVIEAIIGLPSMLIISLDLLLDWYNVDVEIFVNLVNDRGA